MKKVISILFLSMIMQQAIGQTETFDIATFSPPKGWQKEDKQSGMVYSHVDSTGKFSVIIIFASTTGTGDVAKDFKSEWNELAVKKYAADANPTTEKAQTSDGWKTLTGASLIKIEGTDAYIVLTVFNGFGRRISVLSTLNDKAYLAQIDTFLGSVKLDKTKSIVQKKDTQKVNPINANVSEIGMAKFGHLVYTPIVGWKQTIFTNAVSFIPNGLPADRYIETRIMESKVFSGTMQQALEESWNDVLEQFQLTYHLNTKPPAIITEKISYKGWQYIQGEGTARSNDDKRETNYDVFYVNLFVIKVNNRIERIVTVSLKNIKGNEYSLYNNYLWQGPITEFCFNVKFDDLAEKPLGSLKGNTLSGMYEGFKFGSGSLNASYALFFPNGQVFFGNKFPTNGFEGNNTWLSAELYSRNWGTYILKDGKGAISLTYGTVPLKVVGDNLVLTTQNTEHIYVSLPSVDGAVFSGKYTFDGDWDSKTPSVIFTPDGKFTDLGALNILNHQTLDPDEFNITASPGNGTYKIKNYTLICNYSDGRKFQTVFIGREYNRKNLSPASLTLSFNNDILYRQ